MSARPRSKETIKQKGEKRNKVARVPRLTPTRLRALMEEYEERRSELELFRDQIHNFFVKSSEFTRGNPPVVHSVKSRLKDISHLEDKIRRKWKDGSIAPENLFSRITDLAGVRVIHLHNQQFRQIHQAIERQIANGYWYLHETPVANSWDPEASEFFTSLGLSTKLRDTYYTSIHYVVRPQESSALTCEIQVRTLFDEAWGEIDHAMNYPEPTSILACREQLRVLAKLASTGTRLADSIFAAYNAGRDG
jgi:ppGpp synthetase/RelA/SpoT-type nucleotidyltranferase